MTAKGTKAYSAKERARALAALSAHGGDYEAAATETGIAIGTIKSWRSRYGRAIDGRDRNSPLPADAKEVILIRDAEMKEWRTKFGHILHLGVSEIARRIERGEGSLRDITIAVGVAFDKIRLMDNQPTQITAEVDLATFLKDAGYQEPAVMEVIDMVKMKVENDAA